MKILIMIVVLSSALGFSQSRRSFRHSGGMGNGGHIYEMEFKRAGRQILNILESKEMKKDPALERINLYLLGLHIETATIEIAKKNKILKDKFGRVKAALNFPAEKRILISPSHWERVRGKIKLKLPFVLHEFLGLSEEEVDHYQISSKLPSLINQFAESLVMKIRLDDLLAQKYLERDSSIKKLGKITGGNLKYFFAFEDSFGLRKHQIDRLDIVCQNFGYHFYVDSKIVISNYLLNTLEAFGGSITLSKTQNVARRLESVTCAK